MSHSSKSLLCLSILALVVAFISATTTITIERTEEHKDPMTKKKTYIGSLLIDGQAYGKVWEDGDHLLPENSQSKPFYSVEKVFTYEGKDSCSDYDCLRAISGSGAEVLLIKYDFLRGPLDKAHIRIGASVEYTPVSGMPFKMNRAKSTYDSIYAKLGSDLAENDVQLKIVKKYT